MCGFVGVHACNIEDALLSTIGNVIAHRGPDNRCIYRRKSSAITACRLAIFGPKHLPAVAESPAGFAALNGQIYGIGSDDTGDTRALLSLVGDRLDPAIVRNFEGMFAFVYGDGNKIHLCRDRFGIKPLYYTKWRGGVAFGSEIKALLTLPDVDRSADKDVEASCFVFGFNVFPGRTPFAAVRSVRPGTWVTVDQSGLITETEYCSNWASTSLLHRLEGEELDYAIEVALRKSICWCMQQGKGMRGLFLSGGLDSVLLLALAREYGELVAYTLWDGKNYDDLADASAAARYFGVEHRIVQATPDVLDRIVPHYAYYFERPIAGGGFDLAGGIAFHALAKEVAKNHRIALCGEGADELFLGYYKHHIDSDATVAFLMDRIRSTGNAHLLEWANEFGFNHQGPKAADALRRLLRQQGLSEYHLPSVDASGMAFSMEVRPPYLSNELANLVAGCDPAALASRNPPLTKIPLRRILNKKPLADVVHSATRRKRAMAYSCHTAWDALVASIGESRSLEELNNLYRKVMLNNAYNNNFEELRLSRLSNCYTIDQ